MLHAQGSPSLASRPESNSFVQNSLAVMPLPESIVLGEGKMRFSTTQTVSILGKPHPRLYAAATRFVRRLGDRVNILFPQETVTAADTSSTAAFIIESKRAGVVRLGEDESYTLSITPTQVRLTAETDIGALRGIETLLQTIQADTAGYYLPALTARDKPRFAWRGLMLDVCRHFLDASHVKRILDQMALVKLNVMHWHLSEDQGFRVESKVYPRLHEFGSEGMYYTQEQIRDVVRYADGLGIRVMPEFDVPGHTGAWLVGHPELAAGPPRGGTPTHKIERGFGRGSSNMNPTLDTTYNFLDRFFGEMAALFPDDFFHIGGDEVSGRIWRESAQIQEFMKQKGFKTNGELQHYFNSRLRPILQKRGKIMVGWDEIFEGELPKDIVIHSWRGKDSLYRSARAGHRGLLSWGYYIDLMRPAADHYAIDPLPNDTLLTPTEAARVLGGEATMWSEFTPFETVDSRIWPRTAAIAERFWSPRSVTDVEDMYRRLDAVSLRLEECGSQHERNYEMFIRRILNSNDDAAVQTARTLLDVVEPVKEYQRGRYGFSTLMPFSDVVDAALPDAKGVRPFAKLVDAWLLTPSSEHQSEHQSLTIQLKSHLERWRDNHQAFAALVSQAPKLKAAAPMSVWLASSATIALQAVDMLIATNAVQITSETPPEARPVKLSAKKTPSSLSKKEAEKEEQRAREIADMNEQRAVLQAIKAKIFAQEAAQTFAQAKKPFAKCELQVIGPMERLVQAAVQASTQATVNALNTFNAPPSQIQSNR
jgi:hexosaminidase